MLRDAGLFAIRFLRQLAARGLTLTDVAPWNILFRGCRPLFVDFSSIVPLAGDANVLAAQFEKDLRSYYLRSLELSAAGHGRLARLLLTEYDQHPLAESFAAVTRNGTASLYQRGAEAVRRRTRTLSAPADPAAILTKRLTSLEKELAQFEIRRKDAPSAAIRIPRSLVFSPDKLPPASSWWVEVMRHGRQPPLARRSSRLSLTKRRRMRSTSVRTLSRPTSFHWSSISLRPRRATASATPSSPPRLQRLRCELVIALDLLPLLIFERRLRFEQIAGTLGPAHIAHAPCRFPVADARGDRRAGARSLLRLVSRRGLRGRAAPAFRSHQNGAVSRGRRHALPLRKITS